MGSIFGFIGLGLIGGSIAKGLKRADPSCINIAYTRNPATREAALSDGAIDAALTAIDESFLACDYIFLCAPVTANEDYMEQVIPYLSDTAILTDIGSVKTGIHKAAARLGIEDRFIGGHPMAGSEKSGYSFSNDHLVENAYYIITPTPSTPEAKVEEFRQIVLSLKSIPLVLDYARHDYIVAGISHLPHLIAADLVKLVKYKDTPDQTMKLVAAGGFKDITRIASSSPTMWQQICEVNGPNISRILGDYIDMLQGTKAQIDSGNSQAIYDLFSESRDYRDSIEDRSFGPIKKDYRLYCDIVDESGAIATIATILAAHQISIKNIGIVHNRDFEEGVLLITFYDEESLNAAAERLTQFRYTVTKR